MRVKNIFILAISLLLLSMTDAVAVEIHDAAMKGDIKTVRQLLQQNRSLINAPGDNGQTPLHYAVLGGNREMVEILLLKGASINAKDSSNQTPLDLAIRDNKTELVQLLKSKGGAPGASSPNPTGEPSPAATDSGKNENTPKANDSFSFSSIQLSLAQRNSIKATCILTNTGVSPIRNFLCIASFFNEENKIFAFSSTTVSIIEKGKSKNVEITIPMPGKIDYIEIKSNSSVNIKRDGVNTLLHFEFSNRPDHRQ